MPSNIFVAEVACVPALNATPSATQARKKVDDMKILAVAALGCLIAASAQADNLCGKGYQITGDGCRAINAPAWGDAPRKATGEEAREDKSSSASQARLDAAAKLIRIHGYSCKTPAGIRDMLSMSGGYVVHCYGDRPNTEYWYDLEDRSGHYKVVPR